MTRPLVLSALAIAALSAPALAIPTLQVGAPGSGGQGAYADYQGSLSDPTEDDTAGIGGNTIYVGGAYGPKTLSLGGGTWSDFGMPALFNGHGAVLLVSVPDGDTGTLTIDLGGGAVSPFHTSTSDSYFPNNHAPVKADDADFLFFDIGSFGSGGSVPDFADESGSAAGEIKTITFSNTGYDWLHFDALALELRTKGQGFETALQNNPGSHDVTSDYQTPQDPPCEDPCEENPGDPPGETGATPEPVTAAMGAMGLLALAMRVTRRRR